MRAPRRHLGGSGAGEARNHFAKIERQTLYTNDTPRRKSAPGDPLVEALRDLLDRQRADARIDEVGEADARLDDIIRALAVKASGA